MSHLTRTALFLLTVSVASPVTSPGATVEEVAGGFAYEVPEEWQRIPNKHKQVKPGIMFDLLSSKNPKRMVIPQGYETADLPTAISSTEEIIRTQMKISLGDGQSSRIYTDSGIKITRILYSTGSPNTPQIVLFALKLPTGVSACFVGLATSADAEAALADYDAIFATLRFTKSE